MNIQPKWDKESYLNSVPYSARKNAKVLLDWAEENIKVIPQPKKGEVWTGFQLAVDTIGGTLKICKIDVSGNIQWYPGYPGYLLATHPFNSDQFYQEFCEKLNDAHGTSTRIQPSQFNKKGPKISLAFLRVERFISMLDWIKERATASEQLLTE